MHEYLKFEDGPTPGPTGGAKALFLMHYFNIWLVIPLRIVKFDGESIGDGFMTD